MESKGKLKPGGVLRKVRLGLRGRGASRPRQRSERVTVQGKVKLRAEADHETDGQRSGTSDICGMVRGQGEEGEVRGGYGV